MIVESALKDAFAKCVLVASSGNYKLPTTDCGFPGINIYPAGYSYVLGVMSSDHEGKIADFSDWDSVIGQNCEYELAAPGVDIYSTLPGGRYAVWSGTSMSTPVVSAAAAIIRSRYPDKNTYTSRYIMGQLVGATRDTAYFKYIEKEYHYPRINICDSLNNAPKPQLLINDLCMFDSRQTDDNNNEDGIVRAGEVIDIGVSLFNRWGIASDVDVTVYADSEFGVENPYVSFINKTIGISDIGTFATGDNGFEYSDETLTSVSNPIRIKINEQTPNNASITLTFVVSCKNGMDNEDEESYAWLYDYTITVQNGRLLSGVISEDMTLDADTFWIIDDKVLIPEDVTVTVEPGTQIQFWSDDLKGQYNTTKQTVIQVEGRFICEGTAEKPIRIFPCYNDRNGNVTISGLQGNAYVMSSNFVYPDEDCPYTSLRYVDVTNAESSKNTYGDYSFTVTSIDHCRFYRNDTPRIGIEQAIFADSISNSVFEDLGDVGDAYVIAENMTGNLFRNCRLWLNTKEYDDVIGRDNTCFQNNVLLNCRNIDAREMYAMDIYNDNSFTNNAIFTDFGSCDISELRILRTSSGNDTLNASRNFWMPSGKKAVQSLCTDADVNAALNDIVLEPYLTASDDLGSIYPFVTDIYLTDKNGNDIDILDKGEEAEVHILFNRDMAQDVEPVASFGGSAPYGDQVISGGWKNSREWTGSFKLESVVSAEKMYWSVSSAEAANDRWLRSGKTEGFFFFMVDESVVQSLDIETSGVKGYNELSWRTVGYETAAGFNIYRSEQYDPSIPVSQQQFERINETMLSNEEHSFIDTNVLQGKEYFYYITCIDTDLNEYEPSDVAECTALDTIPPYIDDFDPPVCIIKNQPLSLNITCYDNIQVKEVCLMYRTDDSEQWGSCRMQNYIIYDDQFGNNYVGTIPGYELKGDRIEYYIYASDGKNNSYIASAEDPITAEIKNDHDYCQFFGDESAEATCISEGKAEYICSDCEKVIVKTIPKIEHSYDEGVVVTPPTCTNPGEKVYVCTFLHMLKAALVRNSMRFFTEKNRLRHG